MEETLINFGKQVRLHLDTKFPLWDSFSERVGGNSTGEALLNVKLAVRYMARVQILFVVTFRDIFLDPQEIKDGPWLHNYKSAYII